MMPHPEVDCYLRSVTILSKTYHRILFARIIFNFVNVNNHCWKKKIMNLYKKIVYASDSSDTEAYEAKSLPWGSIENSRISASFPTLNCGINNRQIFLNQ